METVTENLKRINERISEAAARSGRLPQEITLVAVTKGRSAEEINEVIKAGAVQIGENRIQEAAAKRPLLNGEITFRLIGHLQTNKAAMAVDLFDTVDSIDSVRAALALSRELEKRGGQCPVLVEVNSSGEESKFGLAPDEVEKKVEEIVKLPGLIVKGLMTIGPLTDEEKEIRKAFRETRKLFGKIKINYKSFETLSMGMTDDFEMAIEEGSNMVRIGRAIFKKR